MEKIIALTAGLALIFMATIVPVMAQSSGASTPDVAVDVNDYLTFSISNASGDCGATSGGECPFKTGSGAVDLISTGANASAFASSKTLLSTTTNSTDGYSVTAFAVNTGTRTTALLRTGGAGGTASDQIADTVTEIANAQAENLDTLTTAEQAVDTGLAIRLTDATTSGVCREAQEDTQWGTGDDNNGAGAAQANWAKLAVAAADQGDTVYSCTGYSAGATTGSIDYFVGVTSTQRTGIYDAKVTFTSTVN